MAQTGFREFLVNKVLAKEIDEIYIDTKTHLEGFRNFFKMLSSRGSLQCLPFARSIFLTKSSADFSLTVTPIEYPVCRVSDQVMIQLARVHSTKNS